MTLNPEAVTVLAGGLLYTEWEHISIDYSLREAVRTFQIAGTERPGQWRFPPGTEIEIAANDELLLSGYVNNYAARGDGDNHTVTIAGRSKSQDLVDNSAVHDTGNWENKSPDEIGQELDQFGVGVVAEVPLRKVPYVQLYQGESPWRLLDRYLRPQGATIMGKADGSVAITNASVAKAHVGSLSEGVNIKAFSAEITDHGRHSDYTVKGQGRIGTGEAALRPVGRVVDSMVKRFRPLIIVNEGDTDTSRAESRAEYEKERAAGLSIAATITTQGWRDEAGKAWEPNYTVFVYSPTFLHLVQDMLIESVSLTQDKLGGSHAQLRLVDPRAYGGQGGGGGGESDAAWG